MLAKWQNKNLSRNVHANYTGKYIHTLQILQADIFPVLKPDCSRRSILDLKKLILVCDHESIPDLQSYPCTNLCTGPRLDGETRSKSDLYSLTHCSASSQIFKAQLISRSEKTTITSDFYASRSTFSSKNLCCNDQPGNEISRKIGYKVNSASGPFLPRKSVDTAVAQ